MASIIRTADETQRYHSLRLLVVIFVKPLSAGFSPHEAHVHETFFGWIMPTLKTSEYTILQIVGLDAAVVSFLVDALS